MKKVIRYIITGIILFTTCLYLDMICKFLEKESLASGICIIFLIIGKSLIGLTIGMNVERIDAFIWKD